MSLLKEALLGVSEYFTVNKLIVICFAILLYEFFRYQKLSVFLKYVLCILAVIIFPVTAAMLLIYQPDIYDYGFIWTLVPVVAVIAYGGVRFLWDMIPQMEQQGRGRFVIGALAVVGILLLLGNRGCIQRVTLEEADLRSVYGQVAESLSGETTLWGPRELMQYIRSRNAEVKLVYGMDMWDAQAAAYDGDAYTPELIAAYEWMQELEEFAYQLEITTDVVLPVPDSIAGKLQSSFDAVTEEGVNVMILPTIAYQRIAEMILEEYETSEVGDYTLLRKVR